MVYTQICSWLDDFVGEDPPTELLDIWDLNIWINETEIIEVFKDVVVPTFKQQRSCDDAEAILKSLIWEYYLFRRQCSIDSISDLSGNVGRIQLLKGTEQMSEAWFNEKKQLLTASEFSRILDSNRVSLIRSKLGNGISFSETYNPVVLTRGDGKISPMAWGYRYEPVVRSIFEKINSCSTFSKIGRVRHTVYDGLAASPDGIILDGIKAGRLFELKAPYSRQLEEEIVPYEYYCQMQIQMEVFDVDAMEYFECNIISVSSWDNIDSKFIGAVAVTGDLEDYSSWIYEYSLIFPNDNEGKTAVSDWLPEGNILEKQIWAAQGWQNLTILRNKRWWSSIGESEYIRFKKDLTAALADPLYLKPRDL
jgi:hypothetical protein